MWNLRKFYVYPLTDKIEKICKYSGHHVTSKMGENR